MTSGPPSPAVVASSVLYGREALLDQAVMDAQRGQTLFALEGASGVGKSALMVAISSRLARAGFYGVANLNAAQLMSEESIIASIYVQLQHLGRDPDAIIKALQKRVTTELPQTLKTVFAAVMADLAKLATDKAGKTIEALQGVVSGKSLTASVESQLTALERDNLRYFLSEFLQAVVDADNPIVIAIDNLDSADFSLISLVRFLIKTKPSQVALILAHNSEVGDNNEWDSVLADVRARGGHLLPVTALDRPAIAAWFAGEIGRSPTDTELDELETASHGRALALKLAVDAIRDGAAQPIQPDYAGYYERARRGLSADARAVAELLAVLNRDALVPEDLLAAAAENLGTTNIAPALDQLQDRRLLKKDGREIALAHSLIQRSWQATINGPRLRRLAQAWFAVVSGYDIAELTGKEAMGLIPVIAEPLIKNRPSNEIALIGDRLIMAGQVRSGLELLDRTWKLPAGNAISADVFPHAFVAARTRLEIGRYREVDEPLGKAVIAATGIPERMTQVLLLQMKLALRRNAYPALWEISDQLQREAGYNQPVQIEAALILNVAYRDLLDLHRLRASTERLLELRKACTHRQLNSVERALARSLAKLGDSEAALAHARAAVSANAAPGSIRGVGNAHLALAEVLRYRRDFNPAIDAYRHATAIGRATGNRDSQLWSLLGEAAAHIEAATTDKAAPVLDEIAALLAEPGYEHALETAHAGLLRTLAGGKQETPEEALKLYERMGIQWVPSYLHSFFVSPQGAGPIPI